MKRWYEEKTKSEGVRDSLWGTYESIKEDTAAQKQLDERHLRLYANVDATNNPYYQTDILQGLTRGVAFNVVQSIIDTLTSKIGSIKPGVTFLSNGGDYSKRTNIKQLNDFVYAMMRATKTYENGREAFQDACIFGNGYLKPYVKGAEIKVERILPAQVHVDTFDGLYGKPSQIFHSKFINKTVLENRFKKKIENSDSLSFQNTNVVDLVEVVEGWYLCEDAGKRRRVIATRDQLLLDVPYPCPFDPIHTLRYKKRPIGFHGIGIVEPLVGIQREINKVVSMIERAVHVGSNLWVMNPAGSGVTEEAFSNARRQLGVITYNGSNPPALSTFNVIAPELFRYLEQLVEKAYELSGISQMSASGRKQPGVTSGVAIQTTLDIETQRYLELETMYHEFYADVAKHLVWLADDLATNQKENLEFTFQQDDSFSNINWRDIDLRPNDYEVQSHITNLFPRSPEGKLERVSEMMQNGLIEPSEARKMLQFPDLKMEEDLATAARDLIKKTVESILDGEEDYEQPTKYDDLQFALTYAVQNYNLARLKKNAPQEVLDRLLDYVSDIEDVMSELEAEQAPPPEAAAPPADAAMPPMPEGEPMPPM